jgi:signal transduction histidine kinase
MSENDVDAELDRLRRALALRDQLADVAGHDLRNPLHSLSIALGELENPDLPDSDRRQFTAAARRSLDKMERILDDFVDLVHLESGTLTFPCQPVSVSWLLDQVSQEHRAACSDASMVLYTAVEGGPLSVLADPDRAKQALGKLVVNAVRHARGGGPVELRASRVGDSVEIVVSDRGPGFSPSLLPDPLDRSPDPTGSRRTRGMGLAVVQAVVKAMGGSVEARNRPEAGAEVRIRLAAAT